MILAVGEFVPYFSSKLEILIDMSPVNYFDLFVHLSADPWLKNKFRIDPYHDGVIRVSASKTVGFSFPDLFYTFANIAYIGFHHFYFGQSHVHDMITNQNLKNVKTRLNFACCKMLYFKSCKSSLLFQI